MNLRGHVRVGLETGAGPAARRPSAAAVRITRRHQRSLRKNGGRRLPGRRSGDDLPRRLLRSSDLRCPEFGGDQVDGQGDVRGKQAVSADVQEAYVGASRDATRITQGDPCGGPKRRAKAASRKKATGRGTL